MQVSKELVTPKKAMEWLKRNVHNRPLSKVTAEKYANVIRDGKWKLNGETIKFNCNGDFIDGQHRLTGCIIAGIPFETYVVRGLQHEAFDSIDQGKVRSGGDVMARRGEKHYNMLASACGLLRQLETLGTIGSNSPIRPDQQVECLDQHPGLRESCELSCANRSEGLLPCSLVAALWYAFSTINRNAANEFFLAVLNGEALSKSDPEYVLRRRLIENKSSTSKLRRNVLSALVIKAWNLRRSGKTVKTLVFGEREEFPRIKGFSYAK